jgi:hypothetical protein
MSRDPWVCPYEDCKQVCPRHWNMKRHIDRKHDFEGRPVKHKLKSKMEHFVNETELIQKKYYGSNPLSPISQYNVIPFTDDVPATDKRLGQEQDPIDSIYQEFKKLKNRSEKIKEIENFLTTSTSYSSNIFLAQHQTHNLSRPIGFRTYVCPDCLTGPIVPVRLLDLERLGPMAFNTEHTCKQEDQQRLKLLVERIPSILSQSGMS